MLTCFLFPHPISLHVEWGAGQGEGPLRAQVSTLATETYPRSRAARHHARTSSPRQGLPAGLGGLARRGHVGGPGD